MACYYTCKFCDERFREDSPHDCDEENNPVILRRIRDSELGDLAVEYEKDRKKLLDYYHNKIELAERIYKPKFKVVK